MPRILITGGSGFLGRAIIRELLSETSPVKPSAIRVFDRVAFNDPIDRRISYVHGDIRNFGGIRKACKDIDLVFHCAAIVDWGTLPEEAVMAVNVTGTANVVKACKEMNVPYLVYTSSLDAIFGGQPLVDIDESLPYPGRHPNSYCASKAEGEKIVLGNNGEGLTTCVLRPADIYGEGDPFHIGSLIGMAKMGFYVKLGNGKAKSQHVYAGNIAWAHVLAAGALLGRNDSISRNVYFITDGPASNFFTFFDRFVEGSGYKIRPRNFRIPRQTAFFIGSVAELLAKLLRPVKKYTPKMSRFAVIYTCTDFTFTSEKARKDFGYTPKYDAEEAYERTIKFFRRPA